MTHRFLAAMAVSVVSISACAPASDETAEPAQALANLAQDGEQLVMPGESHLRNVRQLTVGGENAEAYWAFDGSMLIYQGNKPDAGCDQIFLLDPWTAVSTRVSNGEGRTTCSYFYPSGDQILYSSTFMADPSCPPEPDRSLGYVWPIYPSYDVFVANVDGSNWRTLTDAPGYDAEATFSPLGDRIVFTSMRDGDLDLYTMAPDGSDVVRLTDRPGYDGGAFYSPDGSKIVWRADYPEAGPELDDYRELLTEGLIRPGELEIMIMNADGTDQHPVTAIGGANFAPFFHPSGQKIIFSSNHLDPSGREFDLFMVNLDGTGIEQITTAEGFDGFPMFSPDGRYLVFGSNRNNHGTSDTNVFIAEWVE